METGRLILREWEEKDLEPFYRMSSDPIVMEYFPALLTREDSEQFVEKMRAHFEEFGFGLWIVETKQTREWVGFTGFLNVSFQASFTPAVEIGWRLKPSFWDQGFASEAATACLKFGFARLQFPKVVSFTSILNVRSQAVMKRIGMKEVGVFQHPNLPAEHLLSKHVLYQAARSEWENAAVPTF
ncbi:GNAT family N-acetyltransferase [Leptospira yasudae]|uniref:GNAT family N-acetyltransferase n=1 Tax=Leptospira yasudae TaxID=2202201 RepID=UPI0010914143|nr:GNAT family N-acetyltransferase [Leptospira yasudae]MBW0435282.1 GNAT family N-acetyltransferase [Leptospira yasudae]TGM97908.1 N-acetyltransferase [Leptospira yasudae]